MQTQIVHCLQAKKLLACLIAVALLVHPVIASDVTAVITSDSSKLVVDCGNITTDKAQNIGSKIGDFIYAEELGCEKSISTVTIPTKTETRIVMAGAFLMGTVGSNHFGINSSTRYSAKDIVVTGTPKVVGVKSNTGIGADFRITSVKTRYSTMSTEEQGTYTFGIYGYIASMVPTDGGVGYSDIQSIELDWAGVKITGSYGFKNETTGETTWIPFSFEGNGTSTIDGADLKFTTRTNTSSDHCQKTATDDYECTYSEGYKAILNLANVSNVNETVSCPAIRDFIEENPDLADKFVCKKGGVVIDCKTVEDAKLVCKNKSGETVNCNEVYEKNACYLSGKTADEYGYSCYYGDTKVSCRDAGYGDGCPSLCRLNGTEVSCEDVINLNACEKYNIFPDTMGYTCELNGENVPCSTFGKGTCEEKAVCKYKSDSILCARYENALACGKKYEFTPSANYWCQIGNVKVDCPPMSSSKSCDLTPLVCKNTTKGKVISCSEVANYNACASYGLTALNYPEFVCTFDEVVVPCSIVEPTTSSSCPLPKECRLADGNFYTDCSYMENAAQCAKEYKSFNFLPYYRCYKGISGMDCNENLKSGSCDKNTCSAYCRYNGVTLDGNAETCVCLEPPACTGATSGSGACLYGSEPRGEGTQECICKPSPNCSLQCSYGGSPKADGTQSCSCNEKPVCSELCKYDGLPKSNGTQECACNAEPDCTVQCQYGGAPKANGTQECSCNDVPDCSSQCTYGGTPAANGTNACSCNAAPDCKKNCLYGGSPKANGSQECACNAKPNCSVQCQYGGKPKGDGTEKCSCYEEPNCAQQCTYGGTPNGHGVNTCSCNVAPNCTEACTFGGAPKANGTQECACNAEPNCTVQCQYGGTPKANGTRDCSCNAPPDCSLKCTYGGTPTSNGTSECSCNAEPDCRNKCPYGGIPKANGTAECTCDGQPPCNDLCEWKGSPKGNGTQECECNTKKDCYNPMICAYGGVNNDDGSCACYPSEPPSCSGEDQYVYSGATKINVNTVAGGYCTYGGWCSGQEKDENFRCNVNNCPYGAVYKDATKNTNGAARCPYGEGS